MIWGTMKRAKIDSSGNLQIERKGRLKTQYCHFDKVQCGDWCPLFKEPWVMPDPNETPEYEGYLYPAGATILELCNTTLVFCNLIDEREDQSE